MLQFVIYYLLLLVLASLGINGLYAITRGRWEINPDGSTYWTGKIFKGYHFWLQRHRVEFVPYKGDEWLKIYFQIKHFFKEADIVSIDLEFLIIKKMGMLRTSDFLAFALSKGIKLDMKQMPGDANANNYMVVAYKEKKNYKLPEWVRDPLGECITCMSSVFGTLAFLFFAVLIYHVEPMRVSTEGKMFIAIAWYYKLCLWVSFCVILAYLNEVFANLNAKLKK